MQITNIRNERPDSTLGPTDVRRIGQQYEQLYVNKLDNSDEMDNFLEKYKLPKLIQEK